MFFNGLFEKTEQPRQVALLLPEDIRNVGPSFYRRDIGVLPAFAGVSARLREAAIKERLMNWESVLSLVASALLLVYLTYALLRPEKF